MGRWKVLPGELDPAIIEFIGQLRQLKDDGGLSLRQLAAGTGYSTSSWERYLGGRLLPPREAVELLGAMTHADSERLLARYETAQDAWRRNRSVGLPAPSQDDTRSSSEEPLDPWLTADETVSASASAATTPAVDVHLAALNAGQTNGARLRLVLAAIVSAALGAAVAIIVLLANQQPPAAAAARPPTGPAPVTYACTFVHRNGLWYAGNSTTLSDPLRVDMSGPDVAELQCLLQHAGFSPGGVDGNFGPLTLAAVIQAQKADHLDIDGQVGPQTWAALRR